MSDYDAQESHDRLDGYAAPSQAEFVFGHDSQAAFLATAYASGKMHHAFLFDGPSGIGKASLAFVFARHLIAHPHFETAPATLDGSATQSIIRQMAMGAHPQVLHLTRPIDAKTGKHKTQLTIDETRKIGHFLSHTVAGNGYRVVIVDPVNDMNANAANALLKNLEEPTPRTVFILIAQSSGKLLPTIKSRCLTVRFNPLQQADMQRALDHVGCTQVTDALIDRSGGSPRTAIMLRDNGGMDVIEAAETVISGPHFNASAALKLGEVVSTREAEPIYLLLIAHLLDLLAEMAISAVQANSPESETMSAFHLKVSQSIRQSDLYNLDKRQTVVDLLYQVQKFAQVSSK
jgi:DNA polymerase III subunit delta'